jgi:tetratricopeptide (TPR) repeat protein
MLGEAHAASAYTLVEDWDFAGAEAAFKEAIKLSPSYAGSRHQYSHLLLLLGRFEESLAESKIYQELDPHSVSPIGHLGYHYLYAREYDEAIRWLQKDPASHRELGDAYAMKGMAKQAVDEYLKAAERRGTASDKIAALRNAFARSGMNGYLLKRIEQLQAEKTPDQNAVSIATLYARLGDKEQSFDWLEKAYATHAEGLVRLKEELAFDTLRPDARFKDLLRRVGLPQ